MKEIKKLRLAVLFFILLLGLSLSGFSQLGKIHGVVKEGEAPIVGAKVSLYKDNAPTGKGALTGTDGKYEFGRLEDGNYSVIVTYDEKTIDIPRQISLQESELINFDFATAEQSQEGGSTGPVVIHGKKEIFDRGPITFVTYSKLDIQQGGQPRGIRDLVAISPGIVQKDHGSPLNFRGSRENSSAIYIDGMKLRGSEEIPLAAIEQMSVMTGGLPAEYGDVTGGVIVITTGNPGMTGFAGKGVDPRKVRAARKLEKQLKKEDGSGCNCEYDFLIAFAH